MSISILWQAEASGPKTQLTIELLGAELLVTLSGDVIVDAEWQVGKDGSSPDKTGLGEQLRLALLKPSDYALRLGLLRQGTPFSRKVWQALSEIPLGQVLTYSALAERLGSGPRAVASACRNNPYPGIIPCHRVVSKSGIGGFMGQREGPWVELKRQLLSQELDIAHGRL